MSEHDEQAASHQADPAREMMREFAKSAKLVLYLSIALSVVLLTINLLAAISANGGACAGRPVVGGHTFVFGGSVGLAVVCGLFIWLSGKMAAARDPRLLKLFETLENPSGLIDPIFGRTVAYATLWAFIGMLGVIAAVTVMAYYPVLALCFPSWWAGL